MRDPLIHIRHSRPTAAGFWVRDQDSGELHHVDTHPETGSAVTTHWPILDRWQAYIAERALDTVLSAAAESQRKLDHVFRTLHGKGREVFAPVPSAFWDRVLPAGLPSGGSFSLYFGHDQTDGSRSQGGLVIDDSTPVRQITGFSGGGGEGSSGSGPGAGKNRESGSIRDGGNGGHATPGGGTGGGRQVSHWESFEALETGTWTASTLAMGGGGAAGRDDRSYNQWQRGHAGGPGIVHASNDDVVESTDRNLRGSYQSYFAAGGGAGSGGGFYVATRRGFRLATGTTVDLRNGRSHANDGKGRMTVWAVDSAVIDGTITGGVLKVFQMYPSIPLGGVLVT
ncbi:MAG: hypothetical protein OXR64_06090 [Chloroflexota bacterium]|nr:hypothetical protein [Chloroflexota bacterium]MDE2919402.1 hypothetical protein [Chloroflexota bacterium]